MAISKQQVPSGGWRYTQHSTKTTFVALTFDNLVSAVTDHRKANGMFESDVETEVEKQIEELHPEIVIH